MAIERQSEAAGAGNFSRIEKVTWQPTDRNMWAVPAVQQALISGTRGAAVALGGLTVLTLVFAGLNLWEIAGLAVAVGAVVALADFAWGLNDRFETFREQELSRETYERESTAGASRIEERVSLTLETHNPATGHAEIARLPGVTEDDLAVVAQLDALSVRNVAEAGLSYERSKKLLNQLLQYGFIHYPSKTSAAQWTAEKGAALVSQYRDKEVYDAI